MKSQAPAQKQRLSFEHGTGLKKRKVIGNLASLPHNRKLEYFLVKKWKKISSIIGTDKGNCHITPKMFRDFAQCKSNVCHV